MICDGLQGSGTVINGIDGYVLTDGHVALNIQTLVEAKSCRVGFPNTAGKPTYFYRATIEHAVFNPKLNQDFAIVKIGQAIGADMLTRPFPSLKTNEFTSKGDSVTLLGYSGGGDELSIRSGTILDYVGGFIRTSAEVSPGDSGGTAIDANGNLFGVPTRIVTITDGNEQTVYYELVDIRSVMNWLDTFGLNEHDKFFTHADHNHYHGSAVFITQTDLGCFALGRTASDSSVYCLMGDGTRLSFPLDTTFFSWFSDFDGVDVYDSETIASHRLVRNVTFKPGTLVKSATSPSVYVVVDSFGVLRLIPSEQKAIELWGPAWAGLVFDIPDAFWTNYTIGQPLDS
ncbi:serine protease [Candidatus Uhrbacteria bacterium]|nr:serine protease [Candidatus Uhrbacteria bacterium]